MRRLLRASDPHALPTTTKRRLASRFSNSRNEAIYKRDQHISICNIRGIKPKVEGGNGTYEEIAGPLHTLLVNKSTVQPASEPSSRLYWIDEVPVASCTQLPTTPVPGMLAVGLMRLAASQVVSPLP